MSRVHPCRSLVSEYVLGPLLGRLADHNPFYLISAACMLGGCLGVTNSLSWVSIPLPRLLVLIATINAYEAAVIGLAILLGRRGLWRDSRLLLVLEAFFLVDVTFLNAEIMTNRLALGIAINAMLLILAGVKLHFISQAIGGVALAKRVFVMVQLTVLAALPGVLRHIDHGSVSAMDFYVLWWVVGLMPVAYEIISRLCRFSQRTPATLLGDIYTALPWISLTGHLGIMHYVYGVDYFGAMAAPMLLGLTLVLNRLNPSLLATRRQLLVLRALLPAAAVLVSLNDPHLLTMVFGRHAWLVLTPTRLAISAAYLVYVYSFALRQAVVLVPAGIMAGLLYMLGPTADQWNTLATWAWHDVQTGVDRATPTTATQWGTISVVAAFLFLALGAWISLGHHPKVESLPDESN